MMRRIFFLLAVALVGLVFTLGQFVSPSYFWLYAVLLPILAVGFHNAFQSKKAVLRNFPILGILRYVFEEIRPEIQQYFVESDTDGAPFSREVRSVVYQRAKKVRDTVPFGTQRDLYAPGAEWAEHSLIPKHIDPTQLRVVIGNFQCRKPYSASIFNISAMSYGSLSANAIQALNSGAKLGGFYHNTGEGGVSPHHLSGGGDLVWQIGTGYFGCRNSDGSFSPERFRERATQESIKMIEIKLSQGAKPSHGGILPAAKVTAEIVAIRGVQLGKDVISPPAHQTFSNADGLLDFVVQLRELSGGKPVGFKLCIGQPAEFVSIARAIKRRQVFPDFITVDGAEGGTGAAPLEFTNSIGVPWMDGLTIVRDTLDALDIKKHIAIVTSGKAVTGFNILKAIALGADVVNSARGMLLALGCIQARRCNSNHCPVGVATTDKELSRGLIVSDKKVRVANFHSQTVKAFAELLGACGLARPADLNRSHVFRRTEDGQIRSYEDIYPSINTDPTKSRAARYFDSASSF